MADPRYPIGQVSVSPQGPSAPLNGQLPNIGGAIAQLGNVAQQVGIQRQKERYDVWITNETVRTQRSFMEGINEIEAELKQIPELYGSNYITEYEKRVKTRVDQIKKSLHPKALQELGPKIDMIAVRSMDRAIQIGDNLEVAYTDTNYQQSLEQLGRMAADARSLEELNPILDSADTIGKSLAPTLGVDRVNQLYSNWKDNTKMGVFGQLATDRTFSSAEREQLRAQVREGLWGFTPQQTNMAISTLDVEEEKIQREIYDSIAAELRSGNFSWSPEDSPLQDETLNNQLKAIKQSEIRQQDIITRAEKALADQEAFSAWGKDMYRLARDNALTPEIAQSKIDQAVESGWITGTSAINLLASFKKEQEDSYRNALAVGGVLDKKQSEDFMRDTLKMGEDESLFSYYKRTGVGVEGGIPFPLFQKEVQKVVATGKNVPGLVSEFLDHAVRSKDPIAMRDAASLLAYLKQDPETSWPSRDINETSTSVMALRTYSDKLAVYGESPDGIKRAHEETVPLFSSENMQSLSDRSKEFDEKLSADALRRLKDYQQLGLESPPHAIMDASISRPFLRMILPSNFTPAMENRYLKAARDYYAFSGDLDGAARLGIELVNKEWGYTKYGGRMAQYPPDKYLQPDMAEELDALLQRKATDVLGDERITPIPLPGGPSSQAMRKHNIILEYIPGTERNPLPDYKAFSVINGQLKFFTEIKGIDVMKYLKKRKDEMLDLPETPRPDPSYPDMTDQARVMF